MKNTSKDVDLRIVWFVKGKHRYAFIFEHQAQLNAAAAKWASDPLLSFNWTDAVKCIWKTRKGKE